MFNKRLKEETTVTAQRTE